MAITMDVAKSLSEAVSRGDIAAARTIVHYWKQLPIEERPIVSPFKYSESTILHDAAKNGSIELMRMLTNSLDLSILQRDRHGMIPLHRAAACGHKELCAWMIKDRNCRDMLNAVDKKGQTPLHAAARNGQVDTCRLLLQAGALLNSADANRFTPLQAAFENCHSSVVQYLGKRSSCSSSEDLKNYHNAHEFVTPPVHGYWFTTIERSPRSTVHAITDLASSCVLLKWSKRPWSQSRVSCQIREDMDGLDESGILIHAKVITRRLLADMKNLPVKFSSEHASLACNNVEEQLRVVNEMRVRLVKAVSRQRMHVNALVEESKIKDSGLKFAVHDLITAEECARKFDEDWKQFETETYSQVRSINLASNKAKTFYSWVGIRMQKCFLNEIHHPGISLRHHPIQIWFVRHIKPELDRSVRQSSRSIPLWQHETTAPPSMDALIGAECLAERLARWLTLRLFRQLEELDQDSVELLAEYACSYALIALEQSKDGASNELESNIRLRAFQFPCWNKIRRLGLDRIRLRRHIDLERKGWDYDWTVAGVLHRPGVVVMEAGESSYFYGEASMPVKYGFVSGDIGEVQRRGLRPCINPPRIGT